MNANPFYYPAHEVQRPTHDRVQIRSAEDAHILFESVRLGILRPVIRRLNDAERQAFIRPGSVFVWEESEEAIGLRRWTDGLMWSASRMREPFLFYESKNRSRSSGGGSSVGPRSSTDTFASSSSIDTTSPRSSLEYGIHGLVKQTYSAIVMGDGSRRKWHLTAYLTNADFASLPTVQDDHRLRSISVPKGMYRSGKSRQSAKSLAADWAISSANVSMTDLSTPPSSSDGSQSNLLSVMSPSAYDSASPSGSPTLGYHPALASHRRPSPPSPYSRPPSANRSQSSPYPLPAQQLTTCSGPMRTPTYAPSSYRRSSESPVQLLPVPSMPCPPLQAAPVLAPLQSTYADQRYVLPPQRMVVRTAEDQRMLHMFKSSIP